jgi:3-methyladenine DNA glycosylase AlkD
MNQHSNHIRTGTYVDAWGKDVPGWAVIDAYDGKVITFANTREMAREFASHEHGERIARVHSVTYSVTK